MMKGQAACFFFGRYTALSEAPFSVGVVGTRKNESGQRSRGRVCQPVHQGGAGPKVPSIPPPLFANKGA